MNYLQAGGFFFSFLTSIFCSGSSLLLGLSLVLVFLEVHGFLTAVASSVAERGLQACGLQ